MERRGEAGEGGRIASVSVDLDELHHYATLHGLERDAELERAAAARLACTLGLERALAWAERHALPLTLFAVASDLDDERVRRALERALDGGHEVASHSLTHPYDLVRLGREALDREVSGSFDLLERRLGARPTGFRAPGYLLGEAVLDALEAAGARYDASILSAPLYDLAKMAAMGSMRMAGRRSGAALGDRAVWRAPLDPYRPGRSPFERGARALVELPRAVTRRGRVPLIGTALGLAGARLAPALVRAARRPRHFSLELHAIDFLDVADGVGPLRGHQPELSRSLASRVAALDATASELRREGYVLSTLDEAARAFAPRI